MINIYIYIYIYIYRKPKPYLVSDGWGQIFTKKGNKISFIPFGTFLLNLKKNM